MIAFLSGKIVLKDYSFIILNVNGVGYKIFISNADNLVEDKKTELFIHQHIREDCNDLYGFSDYSQLDIFQKLISVSGVGPKVALSILSAAKPEVIKEAIIGENIALFQSTPGVGKKVAAKIILELKSKISGLEGSGVIGKVDQSDDVVEGLASLGYKQNEIARVIGKIPSNLKSSEEKIHWCLKNITS